MSTPVFKNWIVQEPDEGRSGLECLDERLVERRGRRRFCRGNSCGKVLLELKVLRSTVVGREPAGDTGQLFSRELPKEATKASAS